MKKINIIISVTAFIFATALYLPDTAAGLNQGASIQFDKLEHDFAVVKQGEKVKTVFRFVNSGDKTLIIKKIYSSCQCAVVFSESQITAPGESGTLEVTLDTSKKREELLKPIKVITNDKTNPIITLLIKAYVLLELEFIPSAIFINKIEPGEIVQKTVRIVNNSKENFKIKSIKSSRQGITATLDSYLLPKNGESTLQIKITIPKDSLPKYTGRISITTTSKHFPIMHLPISTIVKGVQKKLKKIETRLNVPIRFKPKK